MVDGSKFQGPKLHRGNAIFGVAVVIVLDLIVAALVIAAWRHW